MVLAAAALGIWGTSSPSIAATPPESFNINCPSASLGGTLPAAVYLPAGYRNGSARFPVIYFLHGLPAGPTAYQATTFVARSVADGGHRAIVVAPQGSRYANSDREYLNWGPRENWPQAISQDLPRCIDGRFRTIATRRGRALIGLSAGGFGAFNIGLRHLDTFAAVESWSGYFAATDPTGLRKLDLGSEQANQEARAPECRPPGRGPRPGPDVHRLLRRAAGLTLPERQRAARSVAGRAAHPAPVQNVSRGALRIALEPAGALVARARAQAHDPTALTFITPARPALNGEGGIRTREGVLTPYSLSRRVPSATRPPLPGVRAV